MFDNSIRVWATNDVENEEEYNAGDSSDVLLRGHVITGQLPLIKLNAIPANSCYWVTFTPQIPYNRSLDFGSILVLATDENGSLLVCEAMSALDAFR